MTTAEFLILRFSVGRRDLCLWPSIFLIWVNVWHAVYSPHFYLLYPTLPMPLFPFSVAYTEKSIEKLTAKFHGISSCQNTLIEK